jgi:VCBS repeat-containing protein
MATKKLALIRNETNPKIKGFTISRFCRILAVLALLLAMVGGATGRGVAAGPVATAAAANSAAVAADAYFVAFPNQDGVEGYEWPLDAAVTLTVDGVPYASPQTVVSNSGGGTYVLFQLEGIHDLVPGEVVELSGGGITKSHKITALAVTGFNVGDNTMEGTTDSDLVVALWVNRDPDNSQTSATPDSGAWKTDFSPFDLKAGDDGAAVQQEEDLDATWVNWQIPLPAIEAFPFEERVNAVDWPIGVTVEMEITGGSGYTDKCVMGTHPGDPSRTLCEIRLDSFDLQPGYEITMGDGVTKKAMTVTELTVKDVDPATDTVAGTTNSPADVHLWVHENPQGSHIAATPDGGGDWKGTPTFDIVPGTGGAAVQADEDNDLTWVNWHALAPWIAALPDTDHVRGHDWPEAATVELEINGLLITSGVTTIAPWDPTTTFIEFDLTSGVIYHLQAGDEVELSGGGFTKSVTVTGLAVNGINGVTDTVSGTTDAPGVDVEVWVHANPDSTYTPVTPAGGGAWSANLAYNIIPGTDGAAVQTDADGDKTWIDWIEVNDPPVITEGAVTAVTMSEDGSPTPFSRTLHASDPNAEDSLTWSVSSPASHGTATASGTGTSLAVGYAVVANYNGADSFRVQVTDGYVTDTITVTVTIQAVNDAPTANDQTVSTEKNTPITVTLSGSDIDSTTLRYFIVGNPAHGALSGTEPNVIYTPSHNFTGTDTFTFRANDYELDGVPATITIHVTPTNTAPVADNQTVLVNEDSPTPITLTATDVDEDPLSFSVVTAPTHGTLTGLAPNLTYTPDANWSGSDSFTYTANDGKVVSNVATISITVAAVNDAPVLAAIGAKSVNELSQLAFTATATDIEGDTLTYSLTGAPSGASISPSSGAFTWTPTEAQGHDSYTFSVCVSDAEPKTDCETITVEVAEVNIAPVLAAIGSKTVEEGNLLTFTATTTDSDLPANTLTYSLIGAPAGASINAGSGVFTWTPSAAQGPASYSFTVQVSDGLATDSETITVTVTQSKYYLYLPKVHKGP